MGAYKTDLCGRTAHKDIMPRRRALVKLHFVVKGVFGDGKPFFLGWKASAAKVKYSPVLKENRRRQE